MTTTRPCASSLSVNRRPPATQALAQGVVGGACPPILGTRAPGHRSERRTGHVDHPDPDNACRAGLVELRRADGRHSCARPHSYARGPLNGRRSSRSSTACTSPAAVPGRRGVDNSPGRAAERLASARTPQPGNRDDLADHLRPVRSPGAWPVCCASGHPDPAAALRCAESDRYPFSGGRVPGCGSPSWRFRRRCRGCTGWRATACWCRE